MALNIPHLYPGMRWLSLVLIVLAGHGVFSVGTAAQSPENLDVSSKRYIVIDAETGEVLAEQNADERVAIASLTKVFTTIEALERGDLDQLITTKPADVYDASSTLMGFGPNETFTLRDLLYGMMLPSGNDAAHAIARALGETPGATDQEAYENFVAMMNERVRNMGLEDTNLRNPHGWGVDGHYSTARDVATFMMYALNYPAFREIIGASTYTTSRGGYTVSTTNRLLSGGYAGLLGGKTGYDDDSGYCLIEVAERGGTTMISVTLDGMAPDIWYQDHVVLLNTGFSAKHQRVSQGLPIQGDVLSFRDPDAAVILASSRSGGSIGAPVGGGDQAQGAALSSRAIVQSSSGQGGGAASSPGSESSEAGLSGSDGRSATTGVIAVAGLIALVVALRGLSSRRTSRADRAAS